MFSPKKIIPKRLFFPLPLCKLQSFVKSGYLFCFKSKQSAKNDLQKSNKEKFDLITWFIISKQ